MEAELKAIDQEITNRGFSVVVPDSLGKFIVVRKGKLYNVALLYYEGYTLRRKVSRNGLIPTFHEMKQDERSAIAA
jgi:hypothetical protein